MKRTVKILSLSLALVMLVFVFASCSGGNIDDYAKKLRDKGYEIEYATRDDVEEMNEEMRDDGFYGYNVVACIYSEKSNGSYYYDYDYVNIMELESSKQARALLEEMESKGYLDDENIVRKGAMIIVGTDKGIEDATGGGLFN